MLCAFTDPSTESPPPLPGGGDKQQMAQAAAAAAAGVNVQQQQAAFGDDGTSQSELESLFLEPVSITLFQSNNIRQITSHTLRCTPNMCGFRRVFAGGELVGCAGTSRICNYHSWILCFAAVFSTLYCRLCMLDSDYDIGLLSTGWSFTHKLRQRSIVFNFLLL